MKENLFKLSVGVAGVYHLLIGAVGILFPAELLVKVSGFILGVSPEVNEQFPLIAKFASVYVLAFGILLIILFLNPVKYRILAIPVLTLFGIRLINKILFFGTIGASFGIPFGRNLFGTLCVFFFFTTILLTLPKKSAS